MDSQNLLDGGTFEMNLTEHPQNVAELKGKE